MPVEDPCAAQAAQHRDHHEITEGKIAAIECRLLSKSLGQVFEACMKIVQHLGPARFGPFPIGLEYVDNGELHHPWFHGIER